MILEALPQPLVEIKLKRERLTEQAFNSFLSCVVYVPTAGDITFNADTGVDELNVTVTTHVDDEQWLLATLSVPILVVRHLVTVAAIGSNLHSQQFRGIFDALQAEFPGTWMAGADISGNVAHAPLGTAHGEPFVWIPASKHDDTAPGGGSSPVSGPALWRQVAQHAQTPYVFVLDAALPLTVTFRLDLMLMIAHAAATRGAQPVAGVGPRALKSGLLHIATPSLVSGILRFDNDSKVLDIDSTEHGTFHGCSIVDSLPSAFLAPTRLIADSQYMDPAVPHTTLLDYFLSMQRSGLQSLACDHVTAVATHDVTEAHTSGNMYELSDEATLQLAGLRLVAEKHGAQNVLVHGTPLFTPSSSPLPPAHESPPQPAVSASPKPVDQVQLSQDGARLVGTTNDPVCCKSDSGTCVTGNHGSTAVLAARAKHAVPGRRLRVGFVTYATGPYNAFVEDLWASILRYGFVEQESHLFVFTDQANNASYLEHSRVHKRMQTRLGWPYDSLGRHFLYLSNAAWMADMDFLYSIDSDAVLVAPLDEVILSERVATLHAYMLNRSPGNDERVTTSGRPFSAAFIAPDTHQCYVCGGFFGGSYQGFVSILSAVVTLARQDLSQHPPRVALWHDETYLNRVLLNDPATLILSPAYMYPEYPVDYSLYVDEESKWVFLADGASSPQNLNELLSVQGRYLPRILNLGVRKHLNKQVAEYQPDAAVLPAIMAAGGNAQQLPLVSRHHLTDVVTFIIKAFERPTCLVRLLLSIASHFPKAQLIVLDDSHEPLLPAFIGAGMHAAINNTSTSFATSYAERFAASTRVKEAFPQLQYQHVQYDTGLAAGRNAMVDNVSTPFTMLLDDDFEVLPDSRLEHLLMALEYGMFDIVGGCIDSAWGYHVLPAPEKQELEIRMDLGCLPADGTPREPEYETDELACFRVDMINNFFMARTDILRNVRWDSRLRLGEHEDFFLRVKQAGVRVGLCRGATARNDNSCDKTPEYKKLRSRVFEFWVIFFHKWNLQRMKTAAGIYTLNCTQLDDAAALAAPALQPSCRIDVQQDVIWFG